MVQNSLQNSVLMDRFLLNVISVTLLENGLKWVSGSLLLPGNVVFFPRQRDPDTLFPIVHRVLFSYKVTMAQKAGMMKVSPSHQKPGEW